MINKENLSLELPDITTSIDSWVDGRFIYLVIKKDIIKYSVDNNSFERMNSNENLSKIVAFDN